MKNLLSTLLQGVFQHRVVEHDMADPQGVFQGGGPMVKMNQAMGGKKPIKAEIAVADDGTASGIPWAAGIEMSLGMAVASLESKLAQVGWGYVVSRDRQEGESDELRVMNGTGAQIIREQQLLGSSGGRAGGGDPHETFGDTVIDLLNSYPFDPSGDTSNCILFFTTSSTKPTASGLSPNEVGKLVADRKIWLFIVGEDGSNMLEMAKGAGNYGAFFPLSNHPSQTEVDLMTTKLTATIAGSISQGAAPTARPAGTQRPQTVNQAAGSTIGGFPRTGSTVANP